MKKLISKGDIILILSLLFAAGLIWAAFSLLNGTGSAVAVIEKNGEVIEKIDLLTVTEKREIKIDGDIPVLIEAENGAIYFTSSECRDKICVRTGKLTKPGQSSVCLPAGVSIYIEGKNTGADAVTG